MVEKYTGAKKKSEHEAGETERDKHRLDEHGEDREYKSPKKSKWV